MLTRNGEEDDHAITYLSLFNSKGCYSGENITVVDKKKNLVVSIKDARYNIDPELAAAIEI